LNGVIHGDLNEATDTLTILPSMLTAAQGTLMLTDGTLGYDSVAGREFGHIDYTLTVGMDPSTMGTFYLYPVAFAGPANTTNFTSAGGYVLTLWGNNWRNHLDPASLNENGGLGVDLRAHGHPIAEPGSLLLMGMGGLVVLGIRRRRRAVALGSV
ncbi:MAG: PEP-CTERM sorting domain-containing protein, partial [Planctomycetota bacterium]|nr:PEP-CTERM sorting domain-containing protein [Planctomycetota bacterium]